VRGNFPRTDRNVREECDDLFIVHGAEDGALGDFEAVGVQDGENRTRFSWVNIFVTMPGSGCWSRLCFAITDHAHNNEIRVIHNCAEGDTESIA
jgi:hypothetical protein